jgi:hypothetical protein
LEEEEEDVLVGVSLWINGFLVFWLEEERGLKTDPKGSYSL